MVAVVILSEALLLATDDITVDVGTHVPEDGKDLGAANWPGVFVTKEDLTVDVVFVADVVLRDTIEGFTVDVEIHVDFGVAEVDG